MNATMQINTNYYKYQSTAVYDKAKEIFNMLLADHSQTIHFMPCNCSVSGDLYSIYVLAADENWGRVHAPYAADLPLTYDPAHRYIAFAQLVNLDNTVDVTVRRVKASEYVPLLRDAGDAEVDLVLITSDLRLLPQVTHTVAGAFLDALKEVTK